VQLGKFPLEFDWVHHRLDLLPAGGRFVDKVHHARGIIHEELVHWLHEGLLYAKVAQVGEALQCLRNECQCPPGSLIRVVFFIIILVSIIFVVIVVRQRQRENKGDRPFKRPKNLGVRTAGQKKRRKRKPLTVV